MDSYDVNFWYWTNLMQVVEKIENLDLSDYFYKWKQDEVERSNFDEVEVEINGKYCHISVNLVLDPFLKINEKSWNKKYLTKLESTLNAVIEFIEWYDELKSGLE